MNSILVRRMRTQKGRLKGHMNRKAETGDKLPRSHGCQETTGNRKAVLASLPLKRKCSPPKYLHFRTIGSRTVRE
jgi:hypothetical protein